MRAAVCSTRRGGLQYVKNKTTISSFSRDLFELWAPGKENGVIMTGYSVEGTIAKDLEKQPDKLNMPDGRVVHVNCLLDSISFSAHSDYNQTSSFIREIKTQHVILVGWRTIWAGFGEGSRQWSQ